MPLIVGELFSEMLDLVSTALDVALAIAQLSGLSTELLAEPTLRLIHVPVRIRFVYGECFERVAGAGLGQGARLPDGLFQLAAQGCGQAAHTITGPSLSFSSTCWRTQASHWSSSSGVLMMAPGSV